MNSTNNKRDHPPTPPEDVKITKKTKVTEEDENMSAAPDMSDALSRADIEEPDPLAAPSESDATLTLEDKNMSAAPDMLDALNRADSEKQNPLAAPSAEEADTSASEKPWTTTTYKRKRTKLNQYKEALILTVPNDYTYSDTDKELRSAAPALKLKNFRAGYGGTYILYPDTQEDSNLLETLDWNNIPQFRGEARIKNTTKETESNTTYTRLVVYQVNISFSDQDIITELKRQNLHVKSVLRYKGNGLPLPTVELITTNVDTIKQLKDGFNIGFTHLKAKEKPKPRPLQCTMCWDYGHYYSTCEGTKKCSNCGEKDCKPRSCKNRTKCANCKEEHSAKSQDCRYYSEEQKKKEEELMEKEQLREKRHTRPPAKQTTQTPRKTATRSNPGNVKAAQPNQNGQNDQINTPQKGIPPQDNRKAKETATRVIQPAVTDSQKKEAAQKKRAESHMTPLRKTGACNLNLYTQMNPYPQLGKPEQTTLPGQKERTDERKTPPSKNKEINNELKIENELKKLREDFKIQLTKQNEEHARQMKQLIEDQNTKLYQHERDVENDINYISTKIHESVLKELTETIIQPLNTRLDRMQATTNHSNAEATRISNVKHKETNTTVEKLSQQLTHTNEMIEKLTSLVTSMQQEMNKNGGPK